MDSLDRPPIDQEHTEWVTPDRNSKSILTKKSTSTSRSRANEILVILRYRLSEKFKSTKIDLSG
jgi:hypothetical protein